MLSIRRFIIPGIRSEENDELMMVITMIINHYPLFRVSIVLNVSVDKYNRPFLFVLSSLVNHCIHMSGIDFIILCTIYITCTDANRDDGCGCHYAGCGYF
jgi:hypothetical protein